MAYYIVGDNNARYVLAMKTEMLVELYDVARLMRTRFDRWARTYGMTRAQGVILARLEGVDRVHPSRVQSALQQISWNDVCLRDRAALVRTHVAKQRGRIASLVGFIQL